jgi:hypothetical protein
MRNSHILAGHIWGVQNMGLYFIAAYMPLFFHCMPNCPDALKYYFTPTKLGQCEWGTDSKMI